VCTSALVHDDKTKSKSLDGGGVSSSSSLLILQALMDDIETVLRESEGNELVNEKLLYDCC